MRPVTAGVPLAGPSSDIEVTDDTEEAIVAVQKKAGRWSGSEKKTAHAAAGKQDAETDRQLQREAEGKRSRPANGKARKAGGEKAGAAQTGTHRYPEPPLPRQHLAKPGLESELDPRPQYLAPDYRGSGKLQGQVALITGGDSGIGRAVAVLFAREGADVAIIYLSEDEDAEETRQAVEAEGRRALLLPGDVTDSAFCRDSVETTVQALGRLDILVNNAAFQEHADSLEDISDAQLEHTFRTNIFGYFYMARAALPHLASGAAIINTGSVTGLQGSKELLDYAATKGAIHAFTKSLAQNVLDRGIRVNAVAPGPVWTPLNPADQDADKVAKFGTTVPMKRPAQPEEIAPSYVFLAAAACSSYITGEILPVLGGTEGG